MILTKNEQALPLPLGSQLPEIGAQKWVASHSRSAPAACSCFILINSIAVS